MVEYTEEEGIKAIIWLQKAVGIDEPEAVARAGWNSMSDREKEQTIDTYNLLNRKNDGKEST